jgi:hypothetical protein
MITADTIRQALRCGNPSCACHKPGGYVHCPGHDDGDYPNFAVSESDGGKILVKDHSGCSQGQVITALKEKGLWPSSNDNRLRTHKSRIVATYDYTDPAGKLVYQVCRYEPKDFSQRRPDGKGNWIWGLVAGEYGRRQGEKDWRKIKKGKGYAERRTFPPCPVTLYRLSEVLKAASVYVAECEKDADNLAALGLTATTNPGGVGKWRKEFGRHFQGKAAIIFSDNDPQGKAHALDVARNLHGVAASVKLIELPGLPAKGDLSDWLNAGGTKEQLLAILKSTPEFNPATAPAHDPEKKTLPPTGPETKPTQAELLIKLAAEAELFHDLNRKGYATIPIDGHFETWPIKSMAFRDWLRGRFYKAHGKPPGGQALQDALDLFAAQARFEGQEHEVYVRMAHTAGLIFVDLANESWEVVEITPHGWRVVARPPVKFRRPRGLAPMPTPQQGGNLMDLRPFINCKPEDWPLVVGWLLGSFSPGPYPDLILGGEQGDAKTTTARILKSSVDPGHAAQRTAPRDVRDLMISASNSWCLSFDNLSDLKDWFSDALCRLATGGGLSTRELYSDADETILDAMRPVILNGIDSLVSRADLADRAILLELPRIGDNERQREADLWRSFEVALPGILGAVFDALSTALANFHTVKLARLPRMADFATWVVAAEPALPWKTGTFLEAYTRNRASVVEHSLEGDPVAVAVRSLMERQETWEGTPTELLNKLTDVAGELMSRSKAWPKAANSLSNRLRRAATFLRASGIEIERAKSGPRLISIRMNMQKTVHTVHTVQTEEPCGFTLDDPLDDPRTNMYDPQKRPSTLEATNDKILDDVDDVDDKKHNFSNPPILADTKRLTAWDQALSQAVKEAVKTLTTNENLKETTI